MPPAPSRHGLPRTTRAPAPTHKPRNRDDRGSARERGYTRAWERFRDQHLKRHPLCEYCLADGRTAVWGLPGEMAALRTQISDLAEGVKRATGEDRVIRQTPGLSYVAEPVYQGERVILYMVAQRTTLGSNCRLIEWSALFTDATGIAVPGSPVNPGGPRRQITDQATRLRIELNPPDTLQPGRIELYLALTYDCAGREVYDRTDPVIYGMLRGPRPG